MNDKSTVTRSAILKPSRGAHSLSGGESRNCSHPYPPELARSGLV